MQKIWQWMLGVLLALAALAVIPTAAYASVAAEERDSTGVSVFVNITPRGCGASCPSSLPLTGGEVSLAIIAIAVGLIVGGAATLWLRARRASRVDGAQAG